MARNMEYHQKVEQSLLKKYRKELWTPFITAVNRYELIQPGDKIAVCISGGKDSMLLAKLMQLLQRISEVPFELVFLVMDPGYREENRRQIEDNAALLEIPVTIFETDIFRLFHTVKHQLFTYMISSAFRTDGITCIADMTASAYVIRVKYIQAVNFATLNSNSCITLLRKKFLPRFQVEKLLLWKSLSVFNNFIPYPYHFR